MPEVHGPIDFVLVEFPPGADLSRVRDEFAATLDTGVVRLWDLLVIRKDEDGSFSGLNLDEIEDDGIGSLTVFAGARSGLLGDEDVAEAASAMEPGTVAALIVYENTWAIPFVAAAMEADGQVIASARIPAQDVMEVLDALESAG